MELSVIVCAYDMQRELPRTILTLSPMYQRGIEQLRYEILVVDNGSPEPVDEAELQVIAPNTRVIRFEPGSPSPVRAINAAMQSTSAPFVALFIDGARMASPGLIRGALDAYRGDPAKIVGTLGFHLGPDVQMRSANAGYDQAVEDALLAKTPWGDNGYTLFDISVLAGSSSQGWFGAIAESNGVFLDRRLWDRLGGLDERFEMPGGGVVNLDFWKRAIAASDHAPWMLLGEGTFHQIHGGAATNGTPQDRAKMFEEYERLNGEPYSEPVYKPRLMGALGDDLRRRFAGASPKPARKAHSVKGRSFSVGVSSELLESVHAGTLKTRYKGRRLCKNPFDLALYLKLLQKLKPGAIIEIGTSEGGSALWLSDQCRVLGRTCEILTLDIEPPPDGVDGAEFFRADSTQPSETFPHSRISEAARPWLVIEDSAHTHQSVLAVLNYFHNLLEPGDYVVVEDGVVADLLAPQYREYDDGPNRAVRDFLMTNPDCYEIDEDLCDTYGRNATYCPNGWLMRK